MGQQYLDTDKFMPAGLVAGVSAAMAMFYIAKIGSHLLNGPPQISRKAHEE
jgi:hypothetical protein